MSNEVNSDLEREIIVKKVALISLWANILLTVGKMVIGWFGNSDAVFADGIHSGADVFASVIVLLVIRISNKSADAEHPYGHGKAEIIVSGLIGILLTLVSIYIVYEAISGFFHPIESPSMLALWIAIFSYVLKEFLYRYSLRIAVQQNSKAMEAIAFDHKADIVASIAASAGVLLAIVGDKLQMVYLMYADKIASLFVAYLIFKIAKEMLTEAFDILLERSVPAETLNAYIATISEFKEVRRIDRIRARELGHYIMVDLRIAVDYSKTIKEGHDLSREIKLALMDKFDNVQEVLIHLNPYFPEK